MKSQKEQVEFENMFHIYKNVKREDLQSINVTVDIIFVLLITVMHKERKNER